LDGAFTEDFKSSLAYTAPTSTSFKTSNSFYDYVETYLPPIYAFLAKNIDERENIDFFKIWEYEWQQLLKGKQIDLSDRPIQYWMGVRGEQFAVANTKLSEIYLSAFLRALAFAVVKRYLSKENAIYLAACLSSVDLDLWQVQPGRCPSWWPKLPDSTEQVDTTIGGIWQQVKTLWEQNLITPDDKILSGLNGSIIHHDIYYELMVTGVFQKVQGPQSPDLSELFERNNEDIETATRPSYRNVLRMSGNLLPSSHKDFNILDDWEFLSAVTCFHPVTHAPRWQPWRQRSGIWSPAPHLLSRPVSCECYSDGIVYRRVTEEIARWQDWTNGITERRNFQSPFPCGSYLSINRGIVEQFAKATNSTFCWLCRLTRYYKKDNISDAYETYRDYRAFGTSTVVRLGN
jgi:hypothetical protein